jgi:hypothetical protein
MHSSISSPMLLGDAPQRSKTTSFIYAILVAASCVALSYFIALVKAKDAIWWYAIVVAQLVAFVIVGMLHLFVARKGRFHAFSPGEPPGLGNTLLLSIIVALSIAALYFFYNISLLILAVACGAAFLLPYLTFYVSQVFESITQPTYKPWYKKDNLIDYKAFVFLTSVALKIKLRPLILENSYSVFEVVVPAQMELGKIFHYFLIQQQNNNASIETKDEFGQPAAWKFYYKKGWRQQLRPLDPDLNLWENQVKAKSVIIAERVIISAETLPAKFQKRTHHELSGY